MDGAYSSIALNCDQCIAHQTFVMYCYAARKVGYPLVYCASLFGLLVVATVLRLNNSIGKRRLQIINQDDSSLPLCLDGVLDRKEFTYDVTDNRIMLVPKRECQLKEYQAPDVTQCIDALIRLEEDQIGGTRLPIHFAFIGDSRVRQLFYGFIKMMPDESFNRKSYYKYEIHQDTNFTLFTNDVVVSFRWRNLLNSDWEESIRQWIHQKPPTYVIMNTAVHHMLPEHGANHTAYYEKLVELKPLIETLANMTQVIWLTSYPTFDFFGHNNSHNTNIHALKISHYNQLITKALDGSGVHFWDSASLLVEEYIRSCTLQRRYDGLPSSSMQSYMACFDYTHPGKAVIRQIIQLFLNHACNCIISSGG